MHNLWTMAAMEDRQIHTPCFPPFPSAPCNTWFGSYCATAVSDKTCFLSALTYSTVNSKSAKRKKKEREKYPDPLWAVVARHSVVLPSPINKCMAKQRQQSILTGQTEFFSTRKRKKKSQNLRGWGLGWFIKMRKWSSFWICFGSARGMQLCCLNKAVDQCCCRCWRWQTVVIEALLWGSITVVQTGTTTQACLPEFERAYQSPCAQDQYQSFVRSFMLIKPFSPFYMAPLLATCDINDAWQRAFFRIPQTAIKVYSSCTTACQGGPNRPTTGSFYKQKHCPVLPFHRLTWNTPPLCALFVFNNAPIQQQH